MNQFYSEGFLQACQKNNVEECKKMLSQGVDINYADAQGNTGVFHAVINGGLDALRFLQQSQASMDMLNKEQNSVLHIACEKQNKEIILFLLTNGFDHELKNGSGSKYGSYGEGSMEMKMFLNGLLSEQKAFDVLKQPQKVKLQQIFDDIDTDNSKVVDLQKAIAFNKFIEDGLSDSMAEKDGKDFIKATAICNKETVNIDEWYFSFSKLYACDPQAYEKFIEDYDKAVEKKGKLRLQGL